jgi:hypothetical protein
MQAYPDSSKKTFCYDGDLNFQGKVKLLIKTAYKINWPAENWYTIPVQLEIVVSRINGRIRLQYSNDLEHGSFLQFLGRPAVKVDVEPVLGTESQINLKSIPTITALITDIVNKEIDNLCYPQKLVMDVPCTTAMTQIDKEGKPITE